MEPAISNLEENITASSYMRDITEFRQFFSWYDYTIFASMLAVSASIGVYFGCFGRKQKSKEYFMGGKKMKAVPVAISLVASHTSGFSLIAIPADVYEHGASLLISIISLVILGAIMAYVFLPVFFSLEITSTYEYLGMRFDQRCRKWASALYSLSVIVYLPMIIYGPVLSFAAVTGIGVHVLTPIVCGVCIFYTSLGGLKAVVWTDAIQFVATAGTMVTVAILGVKSAGGFSEVWQTSLDNGRLDIFKFDLDPTKRDTFWTIVVGLTIHWASYTATDQDYTQKFLAVATFKESVRTVFMYCGGMIVVKIICVFTGLLIFTRYSKCDPLASGVIDKKDQLLPYYVLDVAGHIPGLSGLFIAGIFSAALSTMSSALNALASIIYEDFLKSFMGKKSDQATSYILKLIVVVTGIVSTSMVFLIQYMGGLFSVAITLMSVTHGPLFGMFVLGALFPKSNGKGAFWGSFVSLMAVITIITGTEISTFMGYNDPQQLPVSVSGCNSTLGSDLILNSTLTYDLTSDAKPFFLFRLTFYWYTFLGMAITIVLGVIISYIVEEEDAHPVDKCLVSPVIHFLLPKSGKEQAGERPAWEYKYEPVKKIAEDVSMTSDDNDKPKQYF
ncbi:sodium-coupled monocarboxylate transporter 2-like [Cylas formicarius]|uniref:sodium-coupled monocarboxylate transporter 2-like n=1 Tax=Cylas formicarius TaxID=197179 RepID=UPI002958B2FE|nr:sodium-coupled monocarboxylate transporter 2-like [Cylas formicarius]XP_060535415.1 sodium-coupled monocarboxylate transporter 2-like [Cylas formicarius]